MIDERANDSKVIFYLRKKNSNFNKTEKNKRDTPPIRVIYPYNFILEPQVDFHIFPITNTMPCGKTIQIIFRIINGQNEAVKP